MTACLVAFGVALACSAPAPPPLTVPALPPVGLEAASGPGAPGRAVPPPPPADRWLAEDKLQHFAMSFAATEMAYGGARLRLEPGPARSAAVELALLLGLGKELADVRSGSPFSLKDLAWDAAGVALGYTFAQRIR